MNVCYSPNAFFGGISKNYHTNFLIGNSEYMIIEADEYDQSFLKLNPTISIITSMDKDHIELAGAGEYQREWLHPADVAQAISLSISSKSSSK